MISRFRLIPALAVLLTALSANVLASECATCKGSWKAGGGAFIILRTGDMYDGSKIYKDWGITVNPSAEQFISNGTILGAEFLYSYDYSGTKTNNSSLRSLGIMPTIGFYLPLGGTDRKLTKSFFYFKFGTGIQKYWSHSLVTYPYELPYEGSSSSHSIFLAGQAGFMPMLSNSIGLEIGTMIVREIHDYGQYNVSGNIIQFGAGIAVFAM